MLVLFGLIFASWGALFSPPDSAQDTQKQSQPSEQHASPDPLVDKQQAETNQRPAEKENSESNKQWLLKFADRYGNAINALSTLVMAIFTVALFITTHLLWKSGEKHSERELRAYISYPNAEIRHFGNEFEPLEAVLTVKNCGQTPAYDLRDFMSIIVTDFPCRDFPAPRFASMNTSVGPGDGGKVNVATDAPLTGEQINAILKGEKAIYVDAEIRYWDLFRKTERYTRYRGFYRGTGDLGFFPNKILTLRHTEGGNDSN